MAPVLSLRIRPAPPPPKSSIASHTQDFSYSVSESTPTRKQNTSVRQKASSQPQPKNPQATLLGLPAELRLRIYEYGFQSTLIHMHYNAAYKNAREVEIPARFTWTPCLASNPNYPLFCANPKWSGLCKEESRCSSTSNEPSYTKGIFALVLTCKFIYEESRESLVRNTVISIHPQYLSAWIDRLSTPQIQSLTKVNLSCEDQDLVPLLGRVLEHLPNLQAIAWQGQTRPWMMRRNRGREDEQLEVSRWTHSLPSSMLVAIEAYTWDPRLLHIPSSKEYQKCTIIMREGKVADRSLVKSSGWDDADVEIKVHKSYPVEWRNSAPWRIWWLKNDLTISS